jgi:hypothetical protein
MQQKELNWNYGIAEQERNSTKKTHRVENQQSYNAVNN